MITKRERISKIVVNSVFILGLFILSGFDKKEQNDTVTISGMVIFDDYRGGVVRVVARCADPKQPPDIAAVEMSKPGKYKLEVSKLRGEVFIIAMNIQPGDRGMSIGGYYDGNPIKVESLDIKDIDVKIFPIRNWVYRNKI